MGYYTGDYYRGDYYRGDPGFFSFLGGLAKKAVGFIPGVGPMIEGGIEAATAKKATTAIVSATKPGFFKGATQKIGTAVLKHPVLSGAGAAGLAGAVVGAGGPGKLLKRGERALGFGGRKRRRMRATNPKALRRALRRAYAFERIAMKTIHLVHPRKKGRFGGFRRPKKRVC